MKKLVILLAVSALLLWAYHAQLSESSRLVARIFDSGFALAHDSYNSISVASDGHVYYVLSSESLDTGAKMFGYDPKTDRIQMLGDLTEACGEKGRKAIPQGKSHVRFIESDGKLYFATHVGYYTLIDGMERMGVPPPGYAPYPGGHLLAYDLNRHTFEDFGTAPHGEGIITLQMDTSRKRFYGLTWPTGIFFRYDLPTRKWKDFGGVAQNGENGKGADYQTICRSITVDPRDGSAYFSDSLGNIHRYRYDTDQLEIVRGENLRKDYFGSYDPHSAGHMGYNWRQSFWHPGSAQIYAVHGNSGYLFRFDPRLARVEVLDRITSLPSKRSGMFDQFTYGYLGFTLGPDGNTIYYLTGGPIYENGHRLQGKTSSAMGEAKGREDLHLITYDIAAMRYQDHGAIFFPDGTRPTYVNSIAVGQDGTVYALSRMAEKSDARTDLIAVKLPSP